MPCRSHVAKKRLRQRALLVVNPRARRGTGSIAAAVKQLGDDRLRRGQVGEQDANPTVYFAKTALSIW